MTSHLAEQSYQVIFVSLTVIQVLAELRLRREQAPMRHHRWALNGSWLAKNHPSKEIMAVSVKA